MLAEPAPGFLKKPDHFVDIILSKLTFDVNFAGSLIAHSSSVLHMQEKGYDSRYYFPKSDINRSVMVENDHTTYCPFKGKARYWSLKTADGELVNGAWGYDAPYVECHSLVEHVCFYLEKPEFELTTKG